MARLAAHVPGGMNDKEARKLAERCLPRFAEAGLPTLDAESIGRVSARKLQSLWGGMGYVYCLTITTTVGRVQKIVAKRVQLPRGELSFGDQRKKDSYDVEAAFYSRGHAERLIAAGCAVPFPLHVEASRAEGVTICMTMLEGQQGRGKSSADAFVLWLARLHATYWGARADEACGPEGGLQPQGCYWHLDTRPEEHSSMGITGMMGRLRLAARAIDLRLKADPMQTVCHGDAKGANIMYDAATGAALVYDFQYCGKAAAMKDLAYFLNATVCASSAEEERLLQLYHRELWALLERQGDTPPDWEVLKTCHELALCDWRRFSEVGLGGWGDSATSRVEGLLRKLDGGKALASEQAYIEAMLREFPVDAEPSSKKPREGPDPGNEVCIRPGMPSGPTGTPAGPCRPTTTRRQAQVL